jgi:AraC family transcriptional regulator
MTMIAPLRQPRWLPHVVEYLDAHYTDAVRVRTLATLAGVHPVHLGRVFRQFHRCSVIQYQTRRRIQRARTLLGVPGLSLTRIALMTGFADQSHFTRAFTAMLGCPPGEFRRAVHPDLRLAMDPTMPSPRRRVS